MDGELRELRQAVGTADSLNPGGIEDAAGNNARVGSRPSTTLRWLQREWHPAGYPHSDAAKARDRADHCYERQGTSADDTVFSDL